MPKTGGAQTDAPYHPEDSPVAWFVMLERARQTNDFELASRARHELERLGVRVTYLRRRRRQGVAHES